MEGMEAVEDDDDSIEGQVARSLFRTNSEDSTSCSSSEEPRDTEGGRRSAPIDANATCSAVTEPEPSNRSSSFEICQHMHIRLEQKSVGSIAEKLWPAAEYLAGFVLDVANGRLQTDCDDLQRLLSQTSSCFVVIELGAGVGLTGMELATQLSCRVLLTDLPVGLPILQRNVLRNQLDFCLGKDAVQVQTLEWGNESDTTKALEWCHETVDTDKQQPPPILILGSDCVYWEELHEPLERTLFALLSQAPSGSVCLLAGMRRWKRDNHFYHTLGKHTRTASHELQCTRLQETVSRTNGVREILRVYAVQCVERSNTRT